MIPAARNLEFEKIVQQQTAAFARNTPYHSLELNDGSVIPGIIPVEHLRARLNAFPLPQRLDGKRVLDVGAASGWNSFELERRGANVVAVDCVEYEEFLLAKRLLNSGVDYRVMDVDEMSVENLGLFDYVVFFGVLYHLRHPLMALETICSLTKEAAFVESFVSDELEGSRGCFLEFYETTELGGQLDNWFGPTSECLVALCRSAGFAQTSLLYRNDRRCGVVCRRQWSRESVDRPSEISSPILCFAVNNRTYSHYFHAGKDEYICLFFRSQEKLDKLANPVFIEVNDYGVPLLTLSETGEGEWQANVRVPPGLQAGPHSIRLCTRGSAFSNLLTVQMLPPGATDAAGVVFQPSLNLEVDPPCLILIENTLDHSTEFHGYRAEHLACHFSSSEAILDMTQIDLQIDGESISILAAGRSSNDLSQVNAKLPLPLAIGRHFVRLRTANSPLSNELSFTFQPLVEWV